MHKNILSAASVGNTNTQLKIDTQAYFSLLKLDLMKTNKRFYTLISLPDN
jgi:hypothetical protein